jgi:hypothetical protein
MGLKGYRLWATGQLDSTCRAPPRLPVHKHGGVESARQGHALAVLYVFYTFTHPQLKLRDITPRFFLCTRCDTTRWGAAR